MDVIKRWIEKGGKGGYIPLYGGNTPKPPACVYLQPLTYSQRYYPWKHVKDLETRYPELFPSYPTKLIHTRTTAGIAYEGAEMALDLTAVMEASQAISREIELEPLLTSLMQILVENSGAQTGCLILENAAEWTIEAAYELPPGESVSVTRVLQSLPIVDRLPASIIQSVIQTRESVILNNAIHEGQFVNEPYIQNNQIQSIFCLPLLNQSKLVGVLYLEHKLATGVFTPDRAQVLHLLSTQAAIAIENARLYSKRCANESQMAQFLEAISVGIVIVDQAGRPYFANQRATQLTGKGTVSSVMADQLAEMYQVYVAGTDQPYPTEALPAVRGLRGECSRIDDMEIHQNGKTIPIEAWGTPVFDEQGNVIYAIATFEDITERKQVEAALRDSEAKYRLLFEHNPNPMWIFDAQTLAFLMVNDAAIQHYGYSLDEFLTMTILDIRPSADASKLLNHVSWLRNTLYTRSGEWQHCKKDGTVIDVDITSHAIVWSGVAARCVLVKDITERKRTEQLLANYNQTLEQQVTDRTAALRESEAELRHVYNELRLREQELRLITDALPVCISYVDADRRYRFVNRTYEDWFGCSREQILGKPVCEILGDRAYDVFESYINQVFAGQTVTMATEMPLPSGNKYINGILIPDFDNTAQVRGYYALNTDMSEQRNAAMRERRRTEEALLLDERNRMAREIHDTLAQAFTSIIIHLEAANLKLTTDLESAQALLKTGRDLARSGLAEARRSVEALRPQALENRDLYTALQQLTEQMFFHTDTQATCNLVGQVFPLEPTVENNLLRIGQEALNNTLKYARASQVCVELRYERSHFTLRIKDNGQGFIMNRDSIGGFGLLGMTERAERIGAQLTIQSAPGRGTEIVVRVGLRHPA